eukprot:4621295-Ditylum_brightwellii.AAC.1
MEEKPKEANRWGTYTAETQHVPHRHFQHSALAKKLRQFRSDGLLQSTRLNLIKNYTKVSVKEMQILMSNTVDTLRAMITKSKNMQFNGFDGKNASKVWSQWRVAIEVLGRNIP